MRYVSRVLVIACGALLLASCATAPQREVVMGRAETVTVKVPVLTKCVSSSEIPPIPSTDLRPLEAPEAMWELAEAEMLKWRAYALRADALLRACSGETK